MVCSKDVGMINIGVLNIGEVAQALSGREKAHKSLLPSVFSEPEAQKDIIVVANHLETSKNMTRRSLDLEARRKECNIAVKLWTS